MGQKKSCMHVGTHAAYTPVGGGMLGGGLGGRGGGESTFAAVAELRRPAKATTAMTRDDSRDRVLL